MAKREPVLVASLYRLEEVFRQSACAVVRAQRALDGPLAREYLASCQTRAHQQLHSIPRATVKFNFGLEVNHAGRWLMLIPRGGREEQYTHQLRFDLAAVPEPPPRYVPPAQGSAPLPFYMSEPYFLLPPDDEAALGARLKGALRPGLVPRWESRIPDEDRPGRFKDPTHLLAKEIEKIDEAMASDRATDEQGLVFFRYAGEPRSFLVVRVVGRDANDSVYVVTPGAPTEVLIYSIDGDRSKSIHYRPLHRLLHTVRLWLAGTLPATPVRYPEGAAFRYGLEFLQPFARGMRQGYANALAYLSALDDPAAAAAHCTAAVPGPPPSSPDSSHGAADSPPPSPYPVYYDIQDARARLTYTLEYDAQRIDGGAGMRFNFDVRADADKQVVGEGRASFIESRVLVRAGRVGGEPRVDIEVESPEFVLSGAARQRFISMAVESAAEIGARFASDAYARFVRGEAGRERVVALLAYRGGTAKEKFLAVWPGLDAAGRSRDFAFTCDVDDGKLDDIEPVLRVEDDLEDALIGMDAAPAADAEPAAGPPSSPPAAAASSAADASDVSGEQYRPFHNFFHAVRIWRARMARPEDDQ